MSNDYVLDEQEAEFEEQKDDLIKSWIENGANAVDAAQLFDDMINDPYHSDPDMNVHFDPTIDDRIALYSSNKKT